MLKIRKDIIGINQTFQTPYGTKQIEYFDWAASGRLYKPIEEKISHLFGSFVANTHTETNVTGQTMTNAYHEALSIIKNHVNANDQDVIVTGGSGMTFVINKLQRMLGLKIHEHFLNDVQLSEEDRPIVFVTHMEHHSNHTSWVETIADVVVIPPDEKGLISYEKFSELLEKYKGRKRLIGSFTACSNVTGIKTDYHRLAGMIHEYNGICIVDFSASAPYVSINMHPENPKEKLDAVVFSPHKFLGGPGSSGVLIFNSSLYSNKIPDQPGGGTVDWTNPWGEKSYYSDIELREDGGTPGFLQAIKTALSIRLKESMGVSAIEKKENQLLQVLLEGLESIEGLYVLDGHIKDRLPIVSFYVENIHYNLLVKLLNDVYGIQVRGGCSCAGTYGHFLLDIDKTTSKSITDKLDSGEKSVKPGWIRVSLHPTTTIDSVEFFINSLKDILKNITDYEKEYIYDSETNSFIHHKECLMDVKKWFDL